MDGGSKEEINNFEEDDLIEPLEDADVDQAVTTLMKMILRISIRTCSENISRV